MIFLSYVRCEFPDIDCKYQGDNLSCWCDLRLKQLLCKGLRLKGKKAKNSIIFGKIKSKASKVIKNYK